MLQKPFTKNQKNIWYSQRDEDGSYSAPQYRNIASCFRINDYYTILDGDDRSDVIERHFYGKIDNYLGEMIPKVLLAFANGNVPTLSGEALNNLRQVIMQLAKRTPDFVKDHNDVEMGLHFVKSILEEMDEQSDLIERKIYEGHLNDPAKLRDYGRDIRNRATLPNSDRINKALENLHVRWSKIETEHSYILSSMMAYRIGNGGPNGLMNPNMEIWMPVTPKIALVLIGKHHKSVPHVVTDTRDHIRKVNEYAMRNSTQIASQSKELLESLTGMRSIEI